ncbi:VOC family protein [Undibacterium cyanobacteriorum]|uniref:VOC family protein n=1 Tax=Undibacterium cyanobacteriorum TaxID=3073561 RepID=A0ABY9RKH0_9BURK|nr:VOC family protein [Undibacterium sp. 20NA77.5]WMW80847.1 VOC family protein [Undibacterium sp. 20NA77.5]
MKHPNFVLLYVLDPRASVAFYQEMLGRAPVEASDTFAMFALDSGIMLGLWKREQVLPTVTAATGASELAITVDDQAEVDRLHHLWQTRGIIILQTPCSMDFAYTFVATDLDGHRIRVFAPH